MNKMSVSNIAIFVLFRECLMMQTTRIQGNTTNYHCLGIQRQLYHHIRIIFLILRRKRYGMEHLIHPQSVLITEWLLCRSKVAFTVETYGRIFIGLISFNCYKLAFRSIMLYLVFYLANNKTSYPFASSFFFDCQISDFNGLKFLLFQEI